jgi:hypothetical protein
MRRQVPIGKCDLTLATLEPLELEINPAPSRGGDPAFCFFAFPEFLVELAD